MGIQRMKENRGTLNQIQNLKMWNDNSTNMIISTIQDQIRAIFPSWDAVMEYREIILFACGLTAKPQVALDFVYQMYQEKYIKTGGQPHAQEFLRAACDEVSQMSGVKSIDPLNNQYLIFVNQDFEQMKFRPSRFYVFKLHLDHSIEWNWSKVRQNFRDFNSLPAECVVHVIGNYALELSLKAVREVAKYQEVSIAGISIMDFNTEFDDEMEGDSNAEAQLKEQLAVEDCFTESLSQKFNKTVKVSQNIRLVRITDCRFSSLMYKHLAKELNGCNTLEELMLHSADGVPPELGKSLSTAKSLKKLDVVWCNMLPDTSRQVLKGLSLCSELNTVRFTGNDLSSCMKTFMAGYFSKMTKLDISRTALGEEDIISLSQAFRQSKLLRLQELDLSYNNLKGRIKVLFGRASSKYVLDYNSIETLKLSCTKLSTGDIDLLSQILRIHNLPALKNLDLSDNCLTQCIGEMMTGMVELTSLESLNLAGTEFARADVRDLSDTLKVGKLLHLQELNLQRNNLHRLQDDVEHLLTTCQRKLTVEEMARQVIKDDTLHICLEKNNFSSKFLEEMEQACRGTNIYLVKKRNRWCRYCNILGEYGLLYGIVSSIGSIFLPRGRGNSRVARRSNRDVRHTEAGIDAYAVSLQA